MGYVYRQGRRPQTTSPISYRAADGFLICSLCGRKTKAKNYPMGNEDFNHDPSKEVKQADGFKVNMSGQIIDNM